MTTPTNWPNPERPGYPMFSERDGWHLCKDRFGLVFHMFWDANNAHWKRRPDLRISGSPASVADGFYIGPILTPTQITEMLAGERGRCAKAAQEVGDEYYARRDAADNDDDRVYADERMCAAQECAEAIRNLGAAP